MNNPEGHFPQESPIENEGVETAHESSEPEELAPNIEEAQERVVENVNKLNDHIEELEKLRSRDDMNPEAKSFLQKGIEEIKNYFLANEMINTMATLGLVGQMSSNIHEGKDIAAGILGWAAFSGIVKTAAYLGWGRRSREEKLERQEEQIQELQENISNKEFE